MSSDKFITIMSETWDTDDDICLACDNALHHPAFCDGCAYYSRFKYYGVDYPVKV